MGQVRRDRECVLLVRSRIGRGSLLRGSFGTVEETSKWLLEELVGAGKRAVTLGSGASGTSGGDSLVAGAATRDGAADRTRVTLVIGVTPSGTDGILPDDSATSIL